jgi:hypothetical protein
MENVLMLQLILLGQVHFCNNYNDWALVYASTASGKYGHIKINHTAGKRQVGYILEEHFVTLCRVQR